MVATLRYSMDEAEARRRAARAVVVNLGVYGPVIFACVGLSYLFGYRTGLIVAAVYAAWVGFSVWRVIRGSVAALVTTGSTIAVEPDELVVDRDGDRRTYAWSSLRQRNEDDDVMVLHFRGRRDWVVIPLDRADEEFLDEVRAKDIHIPTEAPVDWRRAGFLAGAIVVVFAGFLWFAGGIGGDDCSVSVEPGQIMVIGAEGRQIYDASTGEYTPAPAANC